MQHVDYIIVGSGFGGSVAALRLAEKGYTVLVLEAGSRFRDEDFPKTNWQVKKFIYAPWLGLRGIMRINFFRGVTILSGAGVGGGSLVYANTLLKPKTAAFKSGTWPKVAGVSDWESELSPHYETARRMLGIAKAPTHFAADRLLHETAKELGYGDTFHAVDVGVFLGEANKTVPDPYFNGEGPARTGCNFCGGCMIGCRHNAKNTLVKNYLYLAEKKGVKVIPDSEVSNLTLNDDGTYSLQVKTPGKPWYPHRGYTAKNVILAAGVLGTLRLMLHCRNITGTLAKISAVLGHGVRTNSESILGIRSAKSKHDFSKGIAIASGVNPNDHTSIEAVRYPHGSDAMGLLVAPLFTSSKSIAKHLTLTLVNLVIRPVEVIRNWQPIGFAKESVIFLVMQTLDSTIRFKLKRRLLWPLRRKLVVDYGGGNPPPALLSEGTTFALKVAEKTDSFAATSVSELIGTPLTAHILGGCPMGDDPSQSVIDSTHQVHGYKGLYVLGGASVPANLGVNPSLTITAMAERAMALIPSRSK